MQTLSEDRGEGQGGRGGVVETDTLSPREAQGPVLVVAAGRKIQPGRRVYSDHLLKAVRGSLTEMTFK